VPFCTVGVGGGGGGRNGQAAVVIGTFNGTVTRMKEVGENAAE
jgi:hypothetical protein